MNPLLSMISAIVLFLMVSCANSVEYYVSPEGNDHNPGTVSEPFQSLERAREAVNMQLEEMPRRLMVVNVKGGTYLVNSPVFFTGGDSGTKRFPVVYRAVDGEEPVFTGSRELKNWQLLNDPEKLGLLVPEVNGKIYCTDIKAAWIEEFCVPEVLSSYGLLQIPFNEIGPKNNKWIN